jgi:UDP-glucuronate decarboxylase
MSTAEDISSVLVTGADGFIGSHLVEELVTSGYKVTAFVQYNSFNSWGWLDNCKPELKGKFTVVAGDIRDPHGVKNAMAGCDAVAHLAALIAIPFSYNSPDSYVDTNIKGTLNVLQAARELNIKRMIHTSTSEVYGDPNQSPQNEEYWGNVNPIGIRSCYDEGKRVAETLFFDYHRELSVEIKVARIFNTYGPRLDPTDGRVVSNFVCQAIQGQDLTVYGDGSQTRSFCYVDDEIRGILALLDSNERGPINIGNPVEFTMLELAELVLELTGSQSQLVCEALPADDPLQRCPDITLARQLLNWEPTVELREGLRHTIEWFQKTL